MRSRAHGETLETCPSANSRTGEAGRWSAEWAGGEISGGEGLGIGVGAKDPLLTAILGRHK